jgi:single-stranded-DNA-specific exonuclease
VLAYDNAATPLTGQPAAALETGTASGDPAGRHLALVGLPNHEWGLQQLAGWLAMDAGWDSVVLLSNAGGQTESRPGLDRGHFTQAYAMFREEGSWIDGPEGYLRRVSEKTGVPLASVRLIQEVFEELGFIRVRGAERTIVADPPRRKLEESERYVRMMRQAEAAGFPDWPLDRLKEWAASFRQSR